MLVRYWNLYESRYEYSDSHTKESANLKAKQLFKRYPWLKDIDILDVIETKRKK